jgi:pantothenate kinase type III
MRAVLTLDLGNSRLKARAWTRSGQAFDSKALWEGTRQELASFVAWLRAHPTRVGALSSVGDPGFTAEVRAHVAEFCPDLLVGPEAGVHNLCREPERVGTDRLYAARGACERVGGSCLVVDAGTAVTVDAVRVAAGARHFLGGAIAPGPALAAWSLAEGTATLPRVVPRVGAAALGTVTEDAIQAGVVVGFRGAVAGLVEAIWSEAALGEVPVVLTGGAREFLLEPRPFTTRACVVEPDLVHLGLLHALLDADRRG